MRGYNQSCDGVKQKVQEKLAAKNAKRRKKGKPFCALLRFLRLIEMFYSSTVEHRPGMCRTIADKSGQVCRCRSAGHHISLPESSQQRFQSKTAHRQRICRAGSKF